MLVNATNLDLVFKGFKAVYPDAFLKAQPQWTKIAMETTGVCSDETYGWMGQFPQLREWFGERLVKNLKAHSLKLENRKFESTVLVRREHIADDKIGVFKPVFSEMGRLAKTHPDELITALLAAGFDTECFDGQYFFETDHPSKNKAGEEITVSNMQSGGDTH